MRLDDQNYRGPVCTDLICGTNKERDIRLFYTRRIRSRAASAPRRPLLANPNLFRNPNMVFESTYYVRMYGYHQIVVSNGTRVVDT